MNCDNDDDEDNDDDDDDVKDNDDSSSSEESITLSLPLEIFASRASIIALLVESGSDLFWIRISHMPAESGALQISSSLLPT